ncbi:MAG: type III secretory pathway component EscR [Gammaproteobacteria bacterium]
MVHAQGQMQIQILVHAMRAMRVSTASCNPRQLGACGRIVTTMTALGKLLILCMFALSLRVLAEAVDDETCDQHRADLLVSLQADRDKTLKSIERSIDKTSNAADKAFLELQREQAWDREAELRARADQIWMDCAQHERGSK